jgi:hypothetical protein
LPDRAKRNQSRWRCVFDANFSLGALGVLAVNDMTPELGLIEGFYGRPWPAADRAAAVTALAPHGYRFYLHAPKADALLRRRWRELHPDAEALALADFAAHCRARSVRFGIGLSPYELYREFDAGGREALAAKLAHLDQIGVNDLAILFDDMRGDLPDLARSQAEIVAFAAERTRATRIIVCPSYYSDDPCSTASSASARRLPARARPPARPRHPPDVDRRRGLLARVHPRRARTASPNSSAASRSSGTTTPSTTARA